MQGKLLLSLLWALSTTLVVRSQHSEQTDHRDFQYNSVVDPATGRYNFAYDTGHDDDIAHTLHMQYRDADGVVRGRYGYTDPRGKLRMVEYEAGPNGFVARGDVGPDLFPHGQAPAAPTSLDDPQPVRSSSYSMSGNDFNLDPAPVQMAGWNPEADPIEQPASGVTESTSSVAESGEVEDPGNQFTTVNVTSFNALDVYGPELGFFSGRAPRVVYYPLENTNSERESTDTTTNQNDDAIRSQPLRENPDVNIYNIDVDPNDIRATASGGGGPVRRSADSAAVQTRTAHALPYSYRNYARYAHDHDAETRSRVYHDHANERRRYYVVPRRYTHDHDNEIRRYRYTHDHDAENRYRSRYTHDHDAERRTPVRSTHDHAAERRAYLRRNSYYNYPRRIFYRDSHSMEPHEHWDNPVYQNYRDRQHSDRHLYARSRNYVVPPTANPTQLRYIPSDKYHDKAYYWTNE